MDSSIQPIQPGGPRALSRVRRTSGDDARHEPFHVGDEPAAETEDTTDEPDDRAPDEDRRVAPQGEDEAGSHLDVTA